MTPQEIQERNNQIALMLNIKIEQCYPENKDYKQHGIVYTLEKEFAENVNSIFLSVSELKFHKDWGWLMEAIRFIYKYFESKEMYWTTIERYPLYSDIESVFVMVSDFAQKLNNKEL